MSLGGYSGAGGSGKSSS